MEQRCETCKWWRLSDGGGMFIEKRGFCVSPKVKSDGTIIFTPPGGACVCEPSVGQPYAIVTQPDSWCDLHAAKSEHGE